jgi:hypothetical protein
VQAASFVLAVVAVLISCLSLGWQVVSFVRGGRRVAVEIRQLFDTQVIVRNTGRLAATITTVYVDMQRTIDTIVLRLDGPELPCQLDQGDKAEWQVHNPAAHRGVIRAVVTLGDGRTIRAVST